MDFDAMKKDITAQMKSTEDKEQEFAQQMDAMTQVENALSNPALKLDMN